MQMNAAKTNQARKSRRVALFERPLSLSLAAAEVP